MSTPEFWLWRRQDEPSARYHRRVGVSETVTIWVGDLPVLFQAVSDRICSISHGDALDDDKFKWNPFEAIHGDSWQGFKRGGDIDVRVELENGGSLVILVKLVLEKEFDQLRQACLEDLRQLSDDLVLLPESDPLPLRRYAIEPGEKEARSALKAVEQLRDRWDADIHRPLLQAIRNPLKGVYPVIQDSRLVATIGTDTIENRQLKRAVHGIARWLRLFRDFTERSVRDAETALADDLSASMPAGRVNAKRRHLQERCGALEWLEDRLSELSRMIPRLPPTSNWQSQPFRMTPALRRTGHYYHLIRLWQTLSRPELIEREDAQLDIAEHWISFIYERWVYLTLVSELQSLGFKLDVESLLERLAMDRYAIRFSNDGRPVVFSREDTRISLWYEPRLLPVNHRRLARANAKARSPRHHNRDTLFTGHNRSVTPDFVLLLERTSHSSVLVVADVTFNVTSKLDKMNNYTDYAWLQRRDGSEVDAQSDGWIIHPFPYRRPVDDHRLLRCHPTSRTALASELQRLVDAALNGGD